jgi:hypothetical protein
MTLRQGGLLTASHNMTTLILVVVSCYKLVAKARERGTVIVGSRCQAMAVTVTVDTSMFIIVNCSYALCQRVQ